MEPIDKAGFDGDELSGVRHSRAGTGRVREVRGRAVLQ